MVLADADQVDALGRQHASSIGLPSVVPSDQKMRHATLAPPTASSAPLSGGIPPFGPPASPLNPSPYPLHGASVLGCSPVLHY